MAPGNNLFYVRVTGTFIGNGNAGSGTMKMNALDAGVHTYTIVDANGTVLMAGNFTI